MASWIVVPDRVGVTEDPGVEVAHLGIWVFGGLDVYKRVQSKEIWGNYGASGLLWRIHN